MKDLLPVGSIIKLDNNEKAMIIGYFPNEINCDEFNDYICCSLEGLKKEHSKLKNDIDYFFLNKNSITDVLFMGYMDNSFDYYNKLQRNMIKKINKIKKKNNKVENDDFERIINNLLNNKNGEKNEK